MLQAAAAAGAAAQASQLLGGNPAHAAHPTVTTAGPQGTGGPVKITWLEAGGLGEAPGNTFGVPWPRGDIRAGTRFSLTTADGRRIPVQTWTTAHWPDGSVKWTAHAVGPEAGNAGAYHLAPGAAPAVPARAVTVGRRGGDVQVDTGVITARIGGNGRALVKSVRRGGPEIARDGRLVLLRQGTIDDGDQGAQKWERFDSDIQKVTVEQDGPVRAVVRVDGKHRRGNRG